MLSLRTVKAQPDAGRGQQLLFVEARGSDCSSRLQPLPVKGGAGVGGLGRSRRQRKNHQDPGSWPVRGASLQKVPQSSSGSPGAAAPAGLASRRLGELPLVLRRTAATWRGPTPHIVSRS